MDLLFEDFQVGDVYDLPPVYASKLISTLLALGAEFYVDGNAVVIEALPEEYLNQGKVVPPEVEEIVAATIAAIEEAPTEEPVVEAPVAEEPVAEAPVAEEPVAEASVAEASVAEDPEIAIAPAPKRGRKPKAVEADEEVIAAPVPVAEEE